MKGRVLYRKLGEKIYTARRKRNITQEELSVITDVDRTYISQIEHGLRNPSFIAVSYTHLRAHETVLDLVCRLLLEKKKKHEKKNIIKFHVKRKENKATNN